MRIPLVALVAGALLAPCAAQAPFPIVLKPPPPGSLKLGRTNSSGILEDRSSKDSVQSPLPQDSILRDPNWRATRTDTLEVLIATCVFLDSAALIVTRSAFDDSTGLETWGQGIGRAIRLSIEERIRAGNCVGRIKVSDSIQSLAAPLASDRTTLLIEAPHVQPVFIGRKPGEGRWDRNATIRWGLWDAESRTWVVTGFESLRDRPRHNRSIEAPLAGDLLASTIGQSLPMRRSTNPSERDAVKVAVLNNRRATFGGWQILGDIGFGFGGTGDTKDLATGQISGSAFVSGAAPGLRVLYVPDWLGFGLGYNGGTVDVNVQKASETAFRRQDFFAIATAMTTIDPRRTDDEGGVAYVNLCLGYASYKTDDLFRESVNLHGAFVRPELGLAYVGPLMRSGFDLGWEANHLEGGGASWSDQMFRFGVHMGIRFLTGP